MGCANSIDGRFQYSDSPKRFTALNVCKFLIHIRKLYPIEKIAVFIDNARIHTSHNVKTVMEHYDIKPVFVLPYEPELQGIEKVWGKMKQDFRKKLTEHKLKKRRFNLLEVFRIILNRINSAMIKRLTHHGWK